ncbi:MAG: hypothetical protein ACFFBH_12905 [Promethearchaeota archaeon]
MTQEIWKNLTNCSYVMIVSLLIPSHFSILGFSYGRSGITVGILLWIHGLFYSGYGIGWIWQTTYTRYIGVQLIDSLYLIIIIAISSYILARVIKKKEAIRKNTVYVMVGLIIFLQSMLLLLNLIMRPFLPFFGYLLWVFALFLLVKTIKTL